MTNEDQGEGITRRTMLLIATATAAALAGTLPAFVASDSAAAATSSAAYGNGQVPTSELQLVAGYYFRKDAAATLVQMRAAFTAARGRSLTINDGYRDLAGQQRAWNDYQNGGNLAAVPGTSNHGWGIAVDFGGDVYSPGYPSADHRWLRENAGTFGWWWAGAKFSQVEPWHWEYSAITNPGTPTPTNAGEKMEAIVSAPNGTVVHLRLGGKTNFASPAEYNTFRDQVAFLRNAGVTDIMALPALSSVPTVTWDTFKFLCRYMGAPEN